MKYMLFILLALAGQACTNSTTAEAQHKLNPAQFEEMLKKDATVQLVDVRTPEEFAAGHIAGARLINIYDADFNARIGGLDKTKPVLVYCAAGSRSASAATTMTKMGFTRVFDLAGGMGAWRSAAKPVTTD